MITLTVSLSTPIGWPALIHYSALKKPLTLKRVQFVGCEEKISEGGVKLIACGVHVRYTVLSVWVALCYVPD